MELEVLKTKLKQAEKKGDMVKWNLIAERIVKLKQQKEVYAK